MNQIQQNVALKSMANWLAHPSNLGKTPFKIVCAGEFDLHDMHYYIFKFRKSFFGKWMVGVCGGFEEDSTEHCGHVFSDMKEYREETAKQECITTAETLWKQWQKETEAEFKRIQESIIKICLNAVGTNVDKICAYCYTESHACTFNMFTLVGEKVRTLSQLEIGYGTISSAFNACLDQLLLLSKVCKTRKVVCPVEMKIVYDVRCATFMVEYTYPPVRNRNLSVEGFDAWLATFLHPKAESLSTPGKKAITLKKQWTVKQSGLRGPMISENAALKDHLLVYFIKYDKCDKHGYDESQLRHLDLTSLEEKTLFSERHVIRDIGVSENGVRYFTSFSGKMYCIDETSGDILWAVRAGNGNCSWEIITDEKNVYMFNEHMYAIDKSNGEIIWESPDNLSHSKCSMAMDAKYIYRCNSGGFVFCMAKNNGEIIWKFGNNIYNGNCILISKDVLFFTGTVNGFGKLLMLNAHTSKLISETSMEMGCTRRPLVTDNLIYLGNELGEIKCYEVSADCKLSEKYSFLSDSSVTTRIVLDGNLLWFATEKGYLYCLNKNTGEELMKKKKIGAAPRWISMYEGGILVLSDKGQIEYFNKQHP